MGPVQHQKLIATRLVKAMQARTMSLAELATATGLAVSRIGNYRTGLRLMKPWDAKVIAAALGIGPAFLLGIEDPAEERLIRNWRALPENERERIAAKLDTEAMAYRGDAIPDHRLGHLSAAGKPQASKPARKSAKP